MKILYNLFVDGIPKAQPRPRMTARGHAYNPGSADTWKDAVISTFLPCHRSTIAEPVSLRVKFFLPSPKKEKQEGDGIPHAKKPDLDNLLKALMDAMTEARIWKDDALVFETQASKWESGRRIGAQITVGTRF